MQLGQRHPLHAGRELDGELLIRRRAEEQRHRPRRLLAGDDLDGAHPRRARLRSRRRPRAPRAAAPKPACHTVAADAVLELARRGQPIGAAIAAGVRRRRREAKQAERRSRQPARRRRATRAACLPAGASSVTGRKRALPKSQRSGNKSSSPSQREKPAVVWYRTTPPSSTRSLIERSPSPIGPVRPTKSGSLPPPASTRLGGAPASELGARVHEHVALDGDEAHLALRDRELLGERHARPLAPVGVVDHQHAVALEMNPLEPPVAVEIAARLGQRRGGAGCAATRSGSSASA